MFYNHKEIEKKWQKFWSINKTFKTNFSEDNPKYYVLDMFPYPSGAGLHVGHPLGYIASDIISRYKRHKGYHVLHPMGFDSFGLPAEQYAIQTGQHPAITTIDNINKYREQLDKIGFSFDWDREVRTSDPSYYKWTQWIFIQLFNAYYCINDNKAKNISELISIFENEGNANVKAYSTQKEIFSAKEWRSFTEKEKSDILLNYRLAFLAEAEVNWCPALGTVLANDEVINGVSERGGHPVVRKKMTQWMMRITAYAERLLSGLESLDWSEPIKESQRNWIGKSKGATIFFQTLNPSPKEQGAMDTENSSQERGYTYTKNTTHYLKGDQTASSKFKFAQQMLKNPTKSEEIMWEALKNSNLGDKFRRQYLIKNYIVDFVCLEKGLIIEIDGEYNIGIELRENESVRSLDLNLEEYEIIRFKNEEILNNLDGVLTKIKDKLNQLPSKKFRNLTEINHELNPHTKEEGVGVRIEVFTTRPDTIFGVTYLTLAPENPLVMQIVTEDKRAEVEKYIEQTTKKSERERMSEVKNISGCFTGAYAIHPFTKEEIPIWISDYVLSGYGTGAVMAVPAGDERDYAFAKHFNLPIKNIFDQDISKGAFTSKNNDFTYVDSEFLNGLNYTQATDTIIQKIEKNNFGKATINYRLRDAVFSRQRYWGEPVPVYFENGIPKTIPTEFLPLELPEVEKYLPTEEGEPPLGRAKNWAWNTKENKVVSTEKIDNKTVFPLELNTMPGWAGSSWYWIRYMDSRNNKELAGKESIDYWQNVDLYVGGSEHATGHLLYSRFWNKFLKDIGIAPTEEPFKKLINQGMIQGFVESLYLEKSKGNKFTHFGKNKLINLDDEDYTIFRSSDYQSLEFNKDLALLNIPVDIVKDYGKENSYFDISSVSNFLNEYTDYSNSVFVTNENYLLIKNGEVIGLFDIETNEKINENLFKFYTKTEIGKMSKRWRNVINPDDICEEYGADCLRLYEMFLGPLEQSKPWNTQGLSGVYGFLKKFYNLYFDGDTPSISEAEPSKEEYKILHTLIKKVIFDIENFSFNTSISQFMITINELQKLKCNKRAILEPLAIVISPYAPHICEELWSILGHKKSIEFEEFPKLNESYLVEESKEYPVSFNGKMKFKLKLPLGLSKEDVQEIIFKEEKTQKELQGKKVKNFIFVEGKIINIVI